MFNQLKNIDTAFRTMRLFCILFLIATTTICCYLTYRETDFLKRGQQRVYVLLNGKLMDALAVERHDKLPVEIRDHVKMFHFYFYGLEPDDKVIKNHLTKALYLGDSTVRTEYDNLFEHGYYSSMIAGNVSQQVLDPDSIQVNTDQQPYYFKYYGKLKISRSTSIVTRSLITEGYIRTLEFTSDNNPHGFLIEKWKVIENNDLTIEKR
jgi:conjugative transposon TraK protein